MLAISRAEYAEAELVGRQTICLMAAQMYSHDIAIDTAVRVSFQIFDKVLEVEKERENS